MTFTPMKFEISASKIDKICKIDLSKFYLIEKQKLSKVCLYMGILILYFGSLHPWFLWSLKELFPIPAAALLFVSYIISNSTKENMYRNTNNRFAITSFTILSFYMIINNAQNINTYIVNLFVVFAIYIIFSLNEDVFEQIMRIIAKTFAVLLIPSIIFFTMYLIGVSLPYKNAVFGDNLYSFSNYYFFMIDDRTLTVLIPRFQSVFLEPGHLGSATTILLLTQMGMWKKWWNITLIFATIISFSLAAYAILLALAFFNLWVQRKNLIKTIIIVVIAIATTASIATFYNDGDNLVNNLILARLEIDEKTGDIVGNNRVDEGFEKEFNKFITTSDAFFGKDMEKMPKGSGNSGYRVFIYQNGLVGLFLVIIFYATFFQKYKDIRRLLTCIFISILIFWIRGYPLWYSNFIPIMACIYQKNK